MNVELPPKRGINKKLIIIYAIIILVCIISIIIAVYVQFYARIDIAGMIGIENKDRIKEKSEEEILRLKEDFGKLFINSEVDDIENQNKKQNQEKKLIYTVFEEKDKKVNDYEIDMHIPYINVKNEIINDYNKEIKKVFADKYNKIKNEKDKNTIYAVDYTANVKDGILSMMVRSSYKEGSKPQKIIIKTFNYDLRNNKPMPLEEILRIEKLEKEKVQHKIVEDIKIEQENAENLVSFGYDVYKRNVKDEMYKIENTKEYYLTNEALYLIYPYGNTNETTETDLIIF